MAAGLVAVLAVVETVLALAAPSRAPSEADWAAASAAIRAGFRPGDLIVAAPAWSDQVMRLHLGDLTPPAVAGRLDAARFGRIWEVGQRGARAPEAEAGAGAGLEATRAGAAAPRELSSSRHGALTVRLLEKAPAQVHYDFTERSADAAPSVGGAACALAGDRWRCPGGAEIRRQIAEVDFGLRRVYLARNLPGQGLALEFPAATLGRELVVAAGLHNVWMRKGGTGRVTVTVTVDGQAVGSVEADNGSGFRVRALDTAAWAGKTARVRFEVASDDPRSRELAVAAEARS